MPRLIASSLIAVLLGPSWIFGETAPQAFIKPVCGNLDNGIVVGKPKIFDDRTLALMLDSMEARLAQLSATAWKEQTALTHQITNLKALSERALSDRVLPAHVLIGFPISVDAGERYSNSYAGVEITVTSKAEGDKPPALIALLPKEKTYNVATIANDPPATTGAWTAQFMSGPDSKDAFYVLRDTDTIAFERLNPVHESGRPCTTGFRESGRDLSFAWQFKPVFGNDKVEPGLRQVYAALALPANAPEDFLADIHVRTQWRSLKRQKRKGSGSEFIEDSVRDELWAGAIRYNPVEMERVLKPKVSEARFVYSGNDQVLVIAEGASFLADTAVMLGDSVIPTARLKIERERHLQFVAPAPLLMRHDLYLTGHFGTPAPLADPRSLMPQWTSDPSWGLKIEHARAHPKDSEQSEVRIKIKSRQRKKPMAELIVNRTLVAIGDRIYPVSTIETEPTDQDALMIRFDAPTATLRNSPRVAVTRLFGGELFRDSIDLVLEDDITASQVNLEAATEDEVTLAVSGSGFSSLAVLHIGGETYTRWTTPALDVAGPTMLTLRLPRKALEGARQLTVTQGFAQAVILPLPEVPRSQGEAARKLRRH